MRFVLFAVFTSGLFAPTLVAGPSANLAANPGFEQGGAVWKSYGGRYYQVVAGTGRNGSTGLRYRKRVATKKKENCHYDQEVPVASHTLYVAGGWFRTDGRLRPALRVAGMDWRTLASVQSDAGGGWRKVETLFDSGEATRVRFQIFGGAVTDRRETAVGVSYCDDVYLREPTAAERKRLCANAVTIDASRTVATVSPLFFGVNSLFTVEDDASRADGTIARRLRELPCRLLRFPGGEMADNYHWKTETLDNPRRWPFRFGPETMNTDEFLAWQRQIGATPIFVVNLESGFVHHDLARAAAEAAAWVQHCNGDQPGRVSYWEIGNECYLRGTYFPLTARQYGEAFVQFARAMKKVDSTIKLGAVGPLGVHTVSPNEKPGQRAPWWPTVTSIVGDAFDFAVVHHYQPVSSPFAAVGVGRPIVELKEYLRKRFPGRRPVAALTEWNAVRQRGASKAPGVTVLAEMVAQYLRAGVDLACFWPLRSPGRGSRFYPLLDRDSNAPLPAYNVLKLYAANIGARLVECRTTNPLVSGCASVSETGNEVCVFLVNRSRWEVDASISLNGAEPRPTHASAIVLREDSAKGAHSRLNSESVEHQGEAWRLPLAPASFVVVRLGDRDAAGVAPPRR